MHMEKVIKSYITDIDAFKEFDDERCSKSRKERFNYSTLNSKQILLVISIRFVILCK